MLTVRADQPRLLGALLAVLLVASGCAVSGDRSAPPGATSPTPTLSGAANPTSSPPANPTGSKSVKPMVRGLPVPPDLYAAFSGLLDTRARALVERDRDAYVSVLDRRDVGFVTAQEGYFDNLAQLPLASLDYNVDRSSLVRGRASYSVVVEITMQIDGFDAVPSWTLDRFRFDEVGTRTRQRYRLASVTDRAWEEQHDVRPQPWEAQPVQVRRSARVLAIFDDSSVEDARPLLRSLEASISDVASRVPYEWDASVLVYALSDTSFVGSLDDLPGDDPEALDAIAFTVPAGSDGARVAATRIVLNPRIVAQSGQARERLLRHELTHVALGEHDDNAPVWLAEGLAEWVSVQVLPEGQRRVGAEALRAARRGIDSMPDDETFNDENATLNYATAWWVCEYLATAFGETAPWVVLDAFATPGVPQSPTIQALLQISVDKLAKRGNALLVRSYAPQPPGDEPSGG